MGKVNPFSGALPSILFVIACMIISWFSLNSYQRFTQHQTELAQQSVRSATQGIARRIDTLRRNITLFSEQNRALLQYAVDHPNDTQAYATLEKTLTAHFPEFYSFTVADINGLPTITGPRTQISTSCRQDLAAFSQDFLAPTLYVHRFDTPKHLHFDLMTRLESDEYSLPFFVSFTMDTLARTLDASTVAGHRLLLVETRHHNETSKAYTAAQQNNEIMLEPFDILLSQPKLAQADVIDSHWKVADIIDQQLLSSEARSLWLKGLTMATLFALMSVVFQYLLRRETQQLDRTSKVIIDVEKDRRRIAMDMHDQVLSDLSYLSRQCGFMHQSVNEPVKMHEHLSDSANALEKVGNSIRGIIDDLHPRSLEILGLDVSLQAYITRNFNASNKLNIDFESTNYQDEQLQDDQKLSLYRITLEALHNIVQHANAELCRVNLSMSEGSLFLVIEDNGKTFQPEYEQYKHIGGLANIHTRAQTLNASIAWKPPRRMQQGTRFELIMALNTHE